jgi:methylated-DNA-[protein]-cysteine S-methyltransferase
MKKTSAITSFAEHVRAVVRQIPKGEARTYKEVATAAGKPGAARAVGTIMKNNYDETVPCHRVIRSDGVIGQYNRGGSEAKKKLLALEGYVKAHRPKTRV